MKVDIKVRTNNIKANAQQDNVLVGGSGGTVIKNAVWGDIGGSVTNQSDLVDYIGDRINEINTPSIEGLASIDYVDYKVSGINIPESYDDTVIKSDIASIKEDLLDKADVSVIPSLDGYATETYVDAKINEINIPTPTPYDDTVIKSDITSIKEELSNKADISDIPSIDGLATTEYVDNKISIIDIPEPYDDLELRIDVGDLQTSKADKQDLAFEGNKNNGISFGEDNKMNGELSMAVGANNVINSPLSMAVGEGITTNNYCEVGIGSYNDSSNGDTLFSVGAGDANFRMNAFEVKNNGDIYMWLGDDYVSLQDTIGNIDTLLTKIIG